MRVSVSLILFLLAVPLQAEEKALVAADMNAIRTAMEMFYFDTNHLTTIENLDDVWESTTPHQSINDGGGALVIEPSVGIPFRRFITSQEFGGPYLSYSSGRAREGPDGDYDEGTPLDLTGTGQPIYFYSPLGLIEPKTGGLSLRYHGDRFDEYMLVSHGLDGVPSGDDVLVSIPGFFITVPAISSARVQLAEQKDSAPFVVVVKGYNLGAEGGEAALLLDGTPAGAIQSWTPTEVVVGFDVQPTGDEVATLRLSGGGLAMQELNLTNEVEEEPITVSDWMWYW